MLSSMITNPFIASPRRRGMARVLVATVAGVTLMAGCGSESGSASDSRAAVPPAAPTTSKVPADKAFDPEKALAAGPEEPYAASMEIITERPGKPPLTMTGRANLNGPFTGHLQMKSSVAATESITTVDSHYVRGVDLTADAAWTKSPRTESSGLADYDGYARLLLASGAASRKGVEYQGNVAAFHLSGHLSIEQIASVDAHTHDSMRTKGVNGFDCDQWIDSQGRTVRFEQRFGLQGAPATNKAAFSDFGAPETFAAPTGG